MDYFRLCMLHFYMAVHMHDLGLHQMAEAFAREADRRALNIAAASGFVNIRPSFLADWWCDHWDLVEWIQLESSAQAEARARAWAQIQNDALYLAHPQGQPVVARYDITQARAREAYRSWQASVNDLRVSRNVSSHLLVGPAGNNEQHDFQQGLVVQEPPPRHNNARVSQPSRQRDGSDLCH